MHRPQRSIIITTTLTVFYSSRTVVLELGSYRQIAIKVFHVSFYCPRKQLFTSILIVAGCRLRWQFIHHRNDRGEKDSSRDSSHKLNFTLTATSGDRLKRSRTQMAVAVKRRRETLIRKNAV